MSALLMVALLSGCGSFDIAVSTNPTPPDTRTEFRKKWCTEQTTPNALLTVRAVKDYANKFINESDSKIVESEAFCDTAAKKIQELTRLEMDNLNQSLAMDLRPLADLPGLKTLTLRNSQIHNDLLDPIHLMKDLERLDLSNNPITQIPALPEKLTTINISNTEMTTETAFDSLETQETKNELGSLEKVVLNFGEQTNSKDVEHLVELLNIRFTNLKIKFIRKESL